MQTAETILALIRERGSKGLPLERVYRLLYNPDLYLRAYGNIYGNKGAMTPGTTGETVDGMSVDKIMAIIGLIRQERYVWSPARRTYIPKKNGKKRPLGIPPWSDKLLQEVIRSILEAYYEPQFSDYSHGFRPGRSTHTALRDIRETWTGTNWFIEGDIKGCFDNISHEILLDTIRVCIHDERFIRLISNMLKAGYLEEWTYYHTYSGTPQGGVVSPILSNIYMHKLDEYITRQLMPKWTQGNKRKKNNEYNRLILRASRLRREGKKSEAERYLKQAIKMPSIDTQDKGYRRLKYIRYADDFLIGFVGPKEEAEQVKEEVREFLQGELKLELSADKTLVTHARTKAAQFLGYEVQVLQDDSQRQRNRQRRTLNANIGLRIPERVAREKCQQYMVGGKVVHRPELLLESDYAIINRYQVVYRGVVNYYRMAHNLHRLRGLKWRMEQSLTKTLANKYQKSVREIYRKYTARVMKDGRTYKALQVIIPRQDKEPLVATWGGIPLKWSPAAEAKDQIVKPKFGRTEIVQRLLANQCEYCGSMENIEVHHIRAMKDLKKHTGKERPLWVQLMAARRRKTMVLCRICHQDITYGRPMRNKPSGTGFMQGQKE